MASLSNINGLFDVHSTGAILFSTSHGTSGQILRSNGNAAPTWVAASTVIGGPYLPIAGGVLEGATSTDTGINFTVGGNLFVTSTSTLTGALSGTSATFSGKATFSDKIQIGSFISNDYAFTLKAASVATLPLAVFEDTASANGNGIVVNSVNTPNNYIADFKIGNVSKVKINKDGGIDVAGNQITIDPASGDAILQLQSSTQTLRVDQNSIRTGTNNNLALFTNGNSNQLVLKQSNGCVGIGTISPTTPLQVNGIVRIDTSGNTAFYEGDGVRLFGSQNYRFRNTSGNVRAIINVTSGNFSLYNASNNITNLIATAGDSYFNSGNVGIGTTSPDTRLTVEGTSGHISANIRCEDGYNASIGFSDASGNWYESYIRYHTDVNDMSFAVNGSERIRITSEGNIRQYAATGGGYSQTKILPKVTPNYPGSGQSGTLENWYQPARGESGIIHYGNVNVAGGAYRCAGFIVFSAADSNTTPVAITIVPTESIGANMVAFGTASGWIQIQNTYGYAIKVMGRVESFIN